VYRCLVPYDNKAGVKFASDDEYNQVFDKSLNQLRALGITVPKEEKQDDLVEENKDGEGE
jgi:hypothetical protein